MPKLLPCSSASAIFVAVDEYALTHLSALVSGPPHTPYAYGLFEFHIFLPDGYPRVPPQMTHYTGKANSVCFGPNLYSTGYVCLSILGTWKGDKVEQWSPKKTISQVLLSIQGLVFDENIISKEPGWETYFSVNSEDNQIFQNMVKILTVRFAMTQQLKNPPFGLETQVLEYFRLQKSQILTTINQWLSAAAKQCIAYNRQDMAYSYNSRLYEGIRKHGYYQVLYAEARELRQVLVDQFGESVPELYSAPIAVASDLAGLDIAFQQPVQAPQSFAPYEDLPIFYEELELVETDNAQEFVNLLGKYRVTGKRFDTAAEKPLSPAGVSRLKLERAQLSHSLPCHPDASIFTVFDDRCLANLQALVTGPVNTPYAHGVFLFEIELPETYPDAPPSIINKNAIWPKEWTLNWNSSQNCLHQVLVELQSALLHGTTEKPREEVLTTKWWTLKFGILEILAHLPRQFKDTIKSYFSAKKDLVLTTAAEWTTEAQDMPAFNVDRLCLDDELVSQFRNSSWKELFEWVFQDLKLALSSLNPK